MIEDEIEDEIAVSWWNGRSRSGKKYRENIGRIMKWKLWLLYF